ncbi:MAG TPA: putative Ig domain-containing protein, partial [Bryobacteraceae bacterium]|nr:putative Ig domain-containing protein [Bryobacteraceae bacterium]
MSFCASNRIRVLVPIIAAFCFLSSIDIAVAQTGGGTRAVCPTTFSTNTDCGYIITIGPRGSISGAAVPNANPYDGSDDALVGVINNSGLPYTGSFTITASYGSGFLDGVFDFEGDGICRYIGPGGFQPSPAGNYCTASQASGTDPGDYGGPGVTFSNITTTNPLSRQDTGTVNIAGLAAGGTTFFSLEGPPASIVFPLAFPNVNIGTFQAGSSISFTATALGGTAPYTFSTTGTLPQGITVNGATITGTAGQTGTFTINFVVTDASASTARGTITYSVSGGGGVLNVSGVDLGTVAQGQSISASISVSGGSPPLIFSTAGATPPGITVNGPTVSGTPTQTGDYDIGIAVKDSTGASGSASVTFSVFGFTGTALSPGITFSPYIASVGVAGGTPPYNFSFSGLPAGLSGNSSGTIDGAVQTPVTSQVSVRVADNSGVSISRTFTLTFTVPPPLSVPSQTLPAGQISSVYSQALSAMGGAPPYNWTIASGTLPAGLNLRPTGVVAGLPSQYGTFSFGVRATDVTGASGVGSATLVIAPLPLTITTGPTSSASAGSPPAISASLASAVANIEYPTQMISAFGGVPPYSFSVSSGALPPGVMLDPTGLLSGTPTSPGSYTFTVTATDSSGGASATIGASGLQPRAPGSGGVSGSATFTVSVRSLSTDLLLSASGLSFALIAGNPTAPPAQIVAVQSTNTAIPISYSVSVSPSSATWLSVSPAGGTTPGTLSVSLNNQAPMLAAAATPYQATVSVACLSPAPCAGNSQQFSVSVSVTSPPPMLSVSSDVIAFTTPSTAPAAMSQGVTLQNSGSGTVGIASISCAASWCTVGAGDR